MNNFKRSWTVYIYTWSCLLRGWWKRMRDESFGAEKKISPAGVFSILSKPPVLGWNIGVMAFDIECTSFAQPLLFFFLSFSLFFVIFFFPSPCLLLPSWWLAGERKMGNSRRSLYEEKGCLCCFCTFLLNESAGRSLIMGESPWFFGIVEMLKRNSRRMERERQRDF